MKWREVVYVLTVMMITVLFVVFVGFEWNPDRPVSDLAAAHTNCHANIHIHTNTADTHIHGHAYVCRHKATRLAGKKSKACAFHPHF